MEWNEKEDRSCLQTANDTSNKQHCYAQQHYTKPKGESIAVEMKCHKYMKCQNNYKKNLIR